MAGDSPGTESRRTVPLSQLIRLMAEHEQLGVHRRTYQAAPASRDTVVRGCGIVAGGLTLIGAICLAAGSVGGGLALGSVALLPAAVAVVRARGGAGRDARLDLFESGLTVYHRGEEVVAYRWDTVQVHQRSIPFEQAATASTDYAITLSGPSGAPTQIDETFEGAREWTPIIQSAVTATQLPQVVAAIDAEQRVEFGELALHLDDLTHRDQVYRWEDVQTIDARHDLVRIKVAGQWKSLAPVATIPNFYIFNEVAERLRLAAAA
ncbi:hypothetical protein EBN03_17155 [Nocardia stercoris]|uniref:Uncharacterized protein n=1 Tax=Nocardia stercoris TaxID=2483361 RepID=A0A3M2L2N2_9NOCA|nr:hypothetical protein EBN03_17155 [Nocardia stercoris]